jgi:hypothetical protein
MGYDLVSGAFIRDDDNVLSNIITGENMPTLPQNFRILLYFYRLQLFISPSRWFSKFEIDYTSTIFIVASLHSEKYLRVHYLVIKT